MTEITSNIANQAGITAALNGSKTGAAAGMGKDDFLKLLMAQMRNQDPLKPMENAQMMAQMAQFSALEATQKLSETMDRSMNLQIQSQAASLVGKYVETIQNEQYVAGEVTSVGFDTENGALVPRLLLDGKTVVDLSDIRRVSTPKTT
jgi:flagellar basal-body rod modification protein FlgD